MDILEKGSGKLGKKLSVNPLIAVINADATSGSDSRKMAEIPVSRSVADMFALFPAMSQV